MVARKSVPHIPQLEHEKDELTRIVAEKKKEVRYLSKELESPENIKRWRSLSGNDPTPEELSAKMIVLEEKINNKQEKLLEKELQLRQYMEKVGQLDNQLEERKEAATQLAMKVRSNQHLEIFLFIHIVIAAFADDMINISIDLGKRV